MLLVDFETFGDLDIRAVGAWRYVEHDSFTPLLMSWCRLGKFSTPVLVAEGIEQIRSIVEGQKSFAGWGQFDRIVLMRILGHGNFEYEDLMVRAAEVGFPLRLDAAATAARVPVQKDTRGRTLIPRFCQPKENGLRRLPEEDPERWDQFRDYCKTDSVVARAIAERTPPLTAREQELYRLDQRINQRGIRVDQTAVKLLRRLAMQAEARLNEIVQATTEKRVRAVSDAGGITFWCRERGVDLPDLQAATVEEWLTKKLPGDVRTVLKARQAGAKASTKKLVRFINCLSRDGRIRGLLQFCGAHTRRWAGRLVQPQNFPRDSFEVAEFDAFLDLLSQDPPLSEVVSKFGSPLVAISKALRGLFIPKDGCRFFIVDYSAIEARILAWLANQSNVLDAYLAGDDVYVAMAARVFNKPESEITKDERFLGKTLVLGCWAADTPVLTQRGWVPIVDVLKEDKLWDGVEWVSHEGVCYSGQKRTIRQHGVAATPDHEILVGDSWRTWSEVLASQDALQSALASANSPFSDTNCGTAEKLLRGSTFFVARVVLRLRSTRAMLNLGERIVATLARNASQVRHKLSTLTSWRIACIENAYSAALARVLPVATTPPIKSGSGTEPEAYRSVKRGGKIGGFFSRTSFLSLGGMTRNSKLIESTTTVGTSPGTYDSLGVVRTSSTHDVVNAGPRHRFTILTEKGPLIVHNCGYMLGWKKLQARLAQEGVVVDDDTAKEYIAAFRTRYGRVVALWENIKVACLLAVRDRKKVRVGSGTRAMYFEFKGGALVLTLPNGACLYYHAARVERVAPPWAKRDKDGNVKEKDKILAVTAMMKDDKGWGRRPLSPGLVTENVVQSIARELMASGMLRAERAGFPVVLTVHDEVIAEVPEARATPEGLVEFERLLCELEPWAAGLPLATEGKIEVRYGK